METVFNPFLANIFINQYWGSKIMRILARNGPLFLTKIRSVLSSVTTFSSNFYHIFISYNLFCSEGELSFHIFIFSKLRPQKTIFLSNGQQNTNFNRNWIFILCGNWNFLRETFFLSSLMLSKTLPQQISKLIC